MQLYGEFLGNGECQFSFKKCPSFRIQSGSRHSRCRAIHQNKQEHRPILKTRVGMNPSIPMPINFPQFAPVNFKGSFQGIRKNLGLNSQLSNNERKVDSKRLNHLCSTFPHESDLSPEKPLPLSITTPNSEPVGPEKVQEMLECDAKVAVWIDWLFQTWFFLLKHFFLIQCQQDCKNVVYQWTDECRRCQGTGFASTSRKKKGFSLFTCIACTGLGKKYHIHSPGCLSFSPVFLSYHRLCSKVHCKRWYLCHGWKRSWLIPQVSNSTILFFLDLLQLAIIRFFRTLTCD